MNTWTADELLRIGASEELQLASLRADGTTSPFVTMWVVRAGDDLYVRSAGGPDRTWYRHAITRGAGTIRADGVERDVTFTDADQAVHGAIDAAYHTKYDRYGPRIVGSVVGGSAHDVTIHLLPID
jgi:hypothetical protein